MLQFLYIIAILGSIIFILYHVFKRSGSSGHTKTVAKLAQNEVEKANQWKEAATSLMSTEKSDNIGLLTLQTISSSLAFPKFDPVIMEYLHPRKIKKDLKKLSERQTMNTRQNNLEIIEELSRKYPKIPVTRLDNVRSKVNKAGELFSSFCSEDEKAIQSLQGYADLNSVVEEVKDLRLKVTRKKKEYMIAACEARQSIVRLFLNSKDESLTGIVQDIIHNTCSHEIIKNFKGDIQNMKTNFSGPLKKSGSSDDILAEWVILEAFYNSIRWSYFPIIKGEAFSHYHIWASDDVVLTNFLLLYILNDKKQYLGIPINLIQSVDKDPEDRGKLIFRLSGNKEIYTVHCGKGMFKTLSKQLEQEKSTEFNNELKGIEKLLCAQSLAVVSDSSPAEINHETII